MLPFHYAGPDEEFRYLAEGLIEGVIHPLAGLDGLLVISQSSTHAYAGHRPDIRQVGRDLGVQYALSGKLYRAGDRLRILTELTEADTGAIVSADRHEGSLLELFDLQDRISAHAVATIAPHIREWELQRARRKPAHSLTAYELMLRAVDLMLRLDDTDFQRARGLLQQAIAEDPSYAPAWAHAADWHMLRIGQGWSPDIAADNAEALRNATAAVERDEGYAPALAIRGHIKSFVETDFAGAAVLLDEALAIGPNIALTWSFASATSGYLGDGPGGGAPRRTSAPTSPRDPYAFRHEHMLSQAHYINGNFEEAVAWGACRGAQPAHHSNLLYALRSPGGNRRSRAGARRRERSPGGRAGLPDHSVVAPDTAVRCTPARLRDAAATVRSAGLAHASAPAAGGRRFRLGGCDRVR